MINAMRPTDVSTGPVHQQLQFPRPPKSLMKAVNGKREAAGPSSEDKTPYRACARPHGATNTEGTVAIRRPSQPGGRRQLHDSVDQVSNFRARLGAVLKRLIANRDVLTLCSLFAWGRMTITIKDTNNELSELWKPKRADVIALFTHVYQKKAEYFAEFPEYDFVFEDATGAAVAIAQFEADTNDFYAMQQELDKHWGVHKRRLCPALRKPSAVARPVSQCAVAPTPTPSQPSSQVSSPHNGSSASQAYFKPGAFGNANQYSSSNGRPAASYPNFAPTGSASFPFLPSGDGPSEDSPNYMSSPDANSDFTYGFNWDGLGDEVLNDSFDGSRLFDGLSDTQEAESADSLQQANDLNSAAAAAASTKSEDGDNHAQFMFGGPTSLFLGGRSASMPVEGMNGYDHKFTLPNFSGEMNFDRRESSTTLPDGSMAGGDMSTTMSLDGSVHHTPVQTPNVQSPIMGGMSQHSFLDLPSSHSFNLQVPDQASSGMNFPRRHTTPAPTHSPQPQTDGTPNMPHPTFPFPMSFPIPGVPFPGAGQLPSLSLLSSMAHPSMLLLSQMAAAGPGGGMMAGGLPGMPSLMGGLPLALLDPSQQAAHLQNLEAQLRALQAQHPDHPTHIKMEDNAVAHPQSLQNAGSAMSLTPKSFSPPGQQAQAQQQAPHPSAAMSRDLAAALRAHHMDQAAMLHYHQAMIAMQMQLLHAQVGAAAGLPQGMHMPLPVAFPGMLGFSPQMAGWPMAMPGAVLPESLLAHLNAMKEQMVAAMQNQDPAQLAQMARMMGITKPEMEERPAR